MEGNTDVFNSYFVIHPRYFCMFDVDPEDVHDKQVRDKVLYYAVNIQKYNKYIKHYSYNKLLDSANESDFMTCSWLLKKSYKHGMPLIFQHNKHFNLHKQKIINYYPLNYNTHSAYIPRSTFLIPVEKKKCFILDHEMLFAMTPAFIGKSISENIMEDRKMEENKEENKKKKKLKKYSDNIIIVDKIRKNMKIYKSLLRKKKIIEKKEEKKKRLIYLDPFVGAGGNIFYSNDMFTIASDININRIEQSKHNCSFYNNNVDFILCDFFNIVNSFRENCIDVAMMSVPWGGPTYKKKKKFN